jgi:hypothetical protein
MGKERGRPAGLGEVWRGKEGGLWAMNGKRERGSAMGKGRE